MQGFIIEVKARQGWVMQILLWFLLLTCRVLTQAATMNHQDPTLLKDFTKSFCEEPTSNKAMFGMSAAFLAKHYATSYPCEMGAWDSDAFPIVINSGTFKSSTPLFSELINPCPFELDL